MAEATAADGVSKLEQLRSYLPQRGRVFIIPHDHPDPDALASAAAMERLLAGAFGLRGQIVFSGMVSRAENRELLRQLRYRWKPLSQVREPRKPVPCIFVDTSPWSGNVTVPAYGVPVAVIDHHPVTRSSKPKGLYKDIRSGTGASATILTEYLQSAGLTVPKWLATIMAFAITTETQDLSRATSDEDLEAYMYLLRLSNLNALGRIRHAALPRDYYGRLGEAMANARTYGRVGWTHLQSVKNPEIVAELADLLLRMERITWSFATAQMGDRLLLSLRSSQPSARCGRLVRKIMGRKGGGGGHHRMAAGYLNLGSLEDEAVARQRQALIHAMVSAIEPRLSLPSGALEEQAQKLVESGTGVIS